MQKTKKFKNKVTVMAFLVLAALLLTPASVQAAKKPGKVKKLEEVSATDTSIKIKFKKVKGAENYQIRVYEANRNRMTGKWKTGKKLVKKMETKKTACTVDGLERFHGYAIKVRAHNGKAYGKWETLRTHTASNSKGYKYPGTTAATGKALEKQYEQWKKRMVKQIKKDPEMATSIATYEMYCSKDEYDDITDYASYSKSDVLQTYKNGIGSDLELYRVMADCCKSAGVKGEIKKWKYSIIQGKKIPVKPIYEFWIWVGDNKICMFSVSEGGGSFSATNSTEHLEEILKEYE